MMMMMRSTGNKIPVVCNKKMSNLFDLIENFKLLGLSNEEAINEAKAERACNLISNLLCFFY
jgi:hypothetical protein